MADADPQTRLTTAMVPPAAAPAMSLRRRLLLIGLAAALLVFGGVKAFHWFTVGRFTQTTDNAYVEADIGVIAPKVQGYVREVRVTDNQPVKDGDILAVIDDADYQAKLAQAQAAIATSRAAVENAGASSARQRSAIAAAVAEIESKRAEKQRTSGEIDRVTKLRADQWISAQRWQATKADDEKASAELEGARAGLSSQQAQQKVLGAQVKIALAYYAQQLAALRAAQLDVDATILRAPFDGVIGNRGVRVGQYVRPGTQLMAVVPLRNVYVVANFKETQMENIRIGQKVTLAIDAFGGRKVQGIVDSIAPAAGSRFSVLPPENATGNFTKIVQRLPVKVRLVDVPSDLRLAPGMSVEASIDTRAKQG